MTNIDFNRRRFLQYAALGTLTTSIPGFASTANRHLNQAPDKTFKPDVEIALTAQTAEVPILPGAATRVLKYTGKLLKGPQAAIKQLPGYLGPILNLEQGQRVRIFFYNQLPEPVLLIGTVCMYRRSWMDIRCMPSCRVNSMSTSLR